MKKTSTLALLLFISICRMEAQTCTDCRYLSPIFDSVTISTTQFGEGITAEGDTQKLYMDIYEPYGDTASPRPVVIFAFGGGFVQGSRDDWYVVEVCKHFTRAGYVSVAIDYRVGVVLNEVIGLQFMRIFFRPMQDMRASIQHLKWDFAENGNTWRIDTNMIFAGGASAGGITALMMQYCDKSTEIAEMGDTAALNALGGFNSTTGFHQNYNWNCAATINVAGALINADWIEPGDDPIISAHGDADNVVPYSEGALAGLSFLGFNLQGSYIVDTTARGKGVCSYLYTMEGRDHPSEDMGLEYFYSIVYRMMLRMEAVRTERSFCCQLSVDVTPGDTLFYGSNNPPATLSAIVSGVTNNFGLHWCSMPCQFSSDSASVTFVPDTNIKYVAATVADSNCLSGDLYIVYDSADLVSDIESIPLQDVFRIFPQPATGTVFIEGSIDAAENGDFTLRLMDYTGRFVAKTDCNRTGNKISAALDVSSLSSGNYVAILYSGHRQLAAQKVSILD